MPPTPQDNPPSRASRLAAAAVCGAALLAGAAEAQPRPGRYEARPAPLVGGGGDPPIVSFAWELAGWVEVEPTEPFPGSRVGARIVDSDLVVREGPLLDEGGGPYSQMGPFPNRGDELWRFEPTAGEADTTLRLLGRRGGESAVLGLWWPDDDRFLLRGWYNESAIGGYYYEVGPMLFDWVGPAGEPPTLHAIDGRFAVTAAWHDGHGGRGHGSPVTFDDRSGIFWFFRPDNPELLVKVIDACEPFGRWWFFAAGLTDVEVEIRVEGPGGVRTYSRPAGEPFAPILDTDAFPCVEPAGS
jgi:hypothetical protein